VPWSTPESAPESSFSFLLHLPFQVLRIAILRETRRTLNDPHSKRQFPSGGKARAAPCPIINDGKLPIIVK